MRLSPRRHVLVLLREAIGMGQKEFAAAARIGESTLQKIELGTYPLRPRIAEKISSYTGVDLDSLRRNDFNEPLLNWRGESSQKSDFEAAQGKQNTPHSIVENYQLKGYKAARLTVTATFLDIYYKLRTMFLGDPNAWNQFNRLIFRLHQLVEETIKKAEPDPKKATLWERVREESADTRQKQKLLTTRGDIDELLDLLAVLEKRAKPARQPKAGATARPRPAPVKRSPSARRRADAQARARRVSSSPSSGRK